MNKTSKYPKAEAWLKNHPELDVIDYMPCSRKDVEEMGYMFISEIEAILNSAQEYGDDYILSCCEEGVINLPKGNPSVKNYCY